MRTLPIVLALGGIAHAQAPGQMAPTELPEMPRWAVGAGLILESLKPQTPGATAQGFGELELDGRFRVRPDLELGLALDLGGSNDYALGAIYIDARYRFRPFATWGWHLVGGIGAASVAHKDAIDNDKKLRGSLRVGIGGDRRFGRFALQAELELVGVTSNTDAAELHGTGESYWLARYGLGGLALGAGATYAF